MIWQLELARVSATYIWSINDSNVMKWLMGLADRRPLYMASIVILLIRRCVTFTHVIRAGWLLVVVEIQSADPCCMLGPHIAKSTHSKLRCMASIHYEESDILRSFFWWRLANKIECRTGGKQVWKMNSVGRLLECPSTSYDWIRCDWTKCDTKKKKKKESIVFCRNEGGEEKKARKEK